MLFRLHNIFSSHFPNKDHIWSAARPLTHSRGSNRFRCCAHFRPPAKLLPLSLKSLSDCLIPTPPPTPNPKPKPTNTSRGVIIWQRSELGTTLIPRVLPSLTEGHSVPTLSPRADIAYCISDCFNLCQLNYVFYNLLVNWTAWFYRFHRES